MKSEMSVVNLLLTALFGMAGLKKAMSSCCFDMNFLGMSIRLPDCPKTERWCSICMILNNKRDRGVEAPELDCCFLNIFLS